jgi:hypothetical protein
VNMQGSGGCDGTYTYGTSSSNVNNFLNVKPKEFNFTAHYDALAAQFHGFDNGRDGDTRPPHSSPCHAVNLVFYSKEEKLKPTDPDWRQYHWLISTSPDPTMIR